MSSASWAGIRPAPTTSPAAGTPEQAWQRANEARLHRNAQRWTDSEEETLFSEEWSGHFIVVTREAQHLTLWLMDSEAAQTDWVQSALDLRDPLRIQTSYVQAMFLSLLWQPAPRHVFLGGLGGGCLATVLHHYLPRTNFVCVELAPPMVAAATQFFGFQPDNRLSVTLDDARAFLDRYEERYDLLLLDIFCDHGSTPRHVTEPGFFALCRRRMHGDGLLTMNLGNNSPVFAEVLHTLCELFATVYACRGRGSTTVLFATDQLPLSPLTLVNGAIDLQNRHDFRFPLEPWTARLKQLHPPRPHASGQPRVPFSF